MKKVLLSLAFALTCSATALAQWTDDMSVNNKIIPDSLENYGYDVKTNGNGISYVFFQVPIWRADSTETISMRLQVLDKDGKALLPGAGQIISEEDNKTWVAENGHLMIDKDGNALITVVDDRIGNDAVTVYKYGPDGKLIWGGITLSKDIDIDIIAHTHSCCSEDGGYVFTYAAYPNSGSSFVAVVKLDKDGKNAWDGKVLKIQDADNKTDYAYPCVIDAGANQYLLVYAKGSNQDLIARMIDFDGSSVWENDMTIYKGGFTSVPLWTMLSVKGAPNGGAFVSWMDARDGKSYENCISSIQNDGSFGFSTGEDGTIISNATSFSRGLPDFYYDKDDNAIYFAYEQFNQANQDYCGVFMQKMSLDGELLWGSEGKPVVDVQESLGYSYIKVRDAGDSKIAVFYQELEGSSDNAPVESKMVVYDKDGNAVIPAYNFTTCTSNRSRLSTSELIDDKYYLTNWEEKRDGDQHETLYMQKVNLKEILDGINTTTNDTKRLVRQEIYNAAGQQSNTLGKGINVIRNIYNDNSTESHKVVK